VATGCSSYFRPADPELPSGESILANYDDPESTLATLQRGIEAKAAGSVAYFGGLAESTSTQTPRFRAFFDPVDKIEYEATSHLPAPSDWGLPEERNFFANLSRLRSDPYRWVWSDVPGEPDDRPNNLFHRAYRLIADDGQAGVPLAAGIADLTFANVNGKWVITRWNDRRSTNDTTTYGRVRLEQQ
jgi:hypothetical protein